MFGLYFYDLQESLKMAPWCRNMQQINTRHKFNFIQFIFIDILITEF